MDLILRVAGTAIGAIGVIGLFFRIPPHLLPGIGLVAVAVLFFGFAELLIRIGRGR